MYLSIKAVAMAVSLFAPPSTEQIHQFIANYKPPVAEVPMMDAADTIEHELFPNREFSYLPPWEATDLVDPPLPPVADHNEVMMEEENVAVDDSGLVAPLPAYWVAGTDEPDADEPNEEAVADVQIEYVDGTDDDIAYSSDAYEAEYSDDYYRDMYNEETASDEGADDEVASHSATIEEMEVETLVDPLIAETLNREWYDEAEAYIPAAPIASEFSESTAADEVADDATDFTNKYEPYAELAMTDEVFDVDQTDASVDHSAAAPQATDLPIDPALVSVIANWHQLSPESRQAILSLVQQHTP